jgi:hypothetical protein
MNKRRDSQPSNKASECAVANLVGATWLPVVLAATALGALVGQAVMLWTQVSQGASVFESAFDALPGIVLCEGLISIIYIVRLLSAKSTPRVRWSHDALDVSKRPGKGDNHWPM